MDFKKRVKGVVTQSLVQALLNDVKYRVVPLGIEEVIRELNTLDADQYRKLDLPQALKRLPDFYVTSVDQDQGWLLEVKYRKKWGAEVREDLGQSLAKQVSLWSPLYLVLFVGEPVRKNDTPASYLGVCKIVTKGNQVGATRIKYQGLSTVKWIEEFTPWDEITWDDFERFQDIFPGISDAWESETLTKTIMMMKSLYEL